MTGRKAKIQSASFSDIICSSPGFHYPSFSSWIGASSKSAGWSDNHPTTKGQEMSLSRVVVAKRNKIMRPSLWTIDLVDRHCQAATETFLTNFLMLTYHELQNISARNEPNIKTMSVR